MKRWFVPFIAVFFLMCPSQPVAAGQPSSVFRMDVAGLGKNQTGPFIALLRDYGVVKTGDIITVSNSMGSSRLLVMSITEDWIEFNRLDFEKGPEKSSDSATTRQSAPRDPFWPVGYRR